MDKPIPSGILDGGKVSLAFSQIHPDEGPHYAGFSQWLRTAGISLLLLAACHTEETGCHDSSSTASGVTGACLSFAAPIQVGRIQDPALVEASGLEASRVHPGVFYAHNDSGDAARFFALDASGKSLGEFDLVGGTAVDWEDLALGPSQSGSDFLYLADIGDNSVTDPTALRREQIEIFRVREPNVAAGQERVQVSLSDWEVLHLRYPDGAHNAETLLADPTGDALWILTKETNGRTNVFSVPASAPAGSTSVLEKLGEVELGSCTNTLLTAGDISADGRLVILRTYGSVLLWERPKGTSLVDALRLPPHRLQPPNELQGEGIAFSADAREWFTLSEGSAAQIFRATASCP
jgi:hypothetical protein